MSIKKKKTKRKVVPKGYDSRLEYDLHNNELKGWNYHPEEKISYAVPSTYEPDFTLEICIEQDCRCTKHRRCGSTKEILVEVKGRFRTRQEATKYIYVRESLEEEHENLVNFSGCQEKQKEVIFLFQDADKPMPFAAKRKDGTKQTHGQWADKNGFRYFCLKRGLPDKWVETLK